MNATEQELQQTVAKVLQQGVNQHKAGQIQAAEELYHAILEVQPEHPDANHNLGVLSVQAQQAEAGLPYFQTAVTANPECEQYWLSYIDTLIQTLQLDAAEQALELGRRHGLQGSEVDKLAKCLHDAQQNSADQQHSISVKIQQSKAGKGPSRQDIKKLATLQRRGRHKAIETFARNLIERFPTHGLGYKTLGKILNTRGLVDEALQSFQKTIDLSPDDHETYNDIGVILHSKGKLNESAPHFQRALKIKPDFTTALCNFGNLLREQDRFLESESYYRRALKIAPNAILYNNLGNSLLDQNKLIEAESCYRRALKITPKFALANLNLGIALRKQGKLEDAIKYQRRALKLDPQNSEQLSNLLFTLNYSSSSSNSFLKEARLLGELVAKKITTPFSSWVCADSPDRLRIGFVSGDFHNHPVGFFLENILRTFNSDRIELFAYPANTKTDDLTDRIKNNFHAWTPLVGMDDEAAAKKIHSDGVHILLDLSGHTTHNRLPVFARKPAPIQASWLGYFATTGISEIDYFLADKVGVPPSDKKNFTETIWYLPDTRLCFSAPDYDIPVPPLPALRNGHITFGCFQQLTKIGDETLELWRTIFSSVPDAHLRLQCKQLDDPTVVDHVLDRLQAYGIPPERVTIHGKMSRKDYLLAHSEVDLILDTFPYPGGTTTCEALWMGVPTLSLAGNSLLSRQGASLLTAAGLSDCVVTSNNDFIEKAIAMVEDLEKLALLRSELREKVINSPLFNSALFTRNFEDALWGMWQEKKPPQKDTVETIVEEKPVMNFFNPVFWGTKDPERFTNLMRQAAELTTAYHFGDNMFLFQRNNSMLNDQPFMQSWEKNVITPPDRTIIWRRYILTMAGFHCQHLEGDFVECGAYQGVGAKTVIDYLGGKDFQKTFWLYDLFEHKEDSVNHPMQAHGPQLHAQVVKRFKEYPNVKIFKGFLPDVLEQGSPDKIAYLHLDLNQAPAEIATLEALFDRVVPGGMIILDDYEMVFYRAQKLAEDTWFEKRGYKVFPLPTSQGFIIKR